MERKEFQNQIRVRLLDESKAEVYQKESICFAFLKHPGSEVTSALKNTKFLHYKPNNPATEFEYSLFREFQPFVDLVGNKSLAEYNQEGIFSDITVDSGVKWFFIFSLARYVDEFLGILQLVEELSHGAYSFLPKWHLFYLAHGVFGDKKIIRGYTGHSAFACPNRVLDYATTETFAQQFPKRPPYIKKKTYDLGDKHGDNEEDVNYLSTYMQAGTNAAVGQERVAGLPPRYYVYGRNESLIPFYYPKTWNMRAEGKFAA